MGVGETSDVAAIALRFRDGAVTAVAAVPGGHINDSYRVDMRHADGTAGCFLLQRLNATVFPKPLQVMDNVARVARHLAQRNPRYPALVSTPDGRDWIDDPATGVWRMFTYVAASVVRQRVTAPADARAAGRAFGEFLRLLGDWDGPLHETIAGFHDTRARLVRLEAVIRADPCGRAASVRVEIDALLAQRALADVLPPLIASGAIPIRPVHNDAKIANVLFDERTGAPLCVIDLDTVMPGSALYDFGDLVRSATSPSDEDEADRSRIGVRLDFYEALARGYLEAAGGALQASERALLGFAGRLITLEQAVRFLTDHLDGDRYYRIERPEHNLIRCRAQLTLLRSLTDQAGALERIIQEGA